MSRDVDTESLGLLEMEAYCGGHHAEGSERQRVSRSCCQFSLNQVAVTQ